jgi:hypothetical protein
MAALRAWKLQLTLRCLNVEVAIHFKHFDFFRELKCLLNFARGYLNFLAIDDYANAHCESLNDSIVHLNGYPELK